MRFLVDAHLPPSLCDILHAAGHNALMVLFQPQLPVIVEALESHSLVELRRTAVQVVT